MANTRAQLRSTTVVLGGMGLLAAALAACSSEPDKRCVDHGSYQLAKGYKVVADQNCTTATKVNGSWYYGGKKKGSWVKGGSFTAPRNGSGGSGTTHTSRNRYGGGSSYDDGDSGVHRGGFGGGHGSSGG
ncbi:hypothetical protein [Streptomyces sp. LaPpAH-108]|uniref:hypothetical protein n=1 Tax=Streptomyces sp. LaPpAH-108 TaxID=1155714 RepID=UPI0003789B8A|nr:hypothetical protein [Streptomyces sp. LaPpAH-108]